jgi:hypothetical protein
MYVFSMYYLGWAILGLKLCIPNRILTLTATLMDFLDPISRFADATAAPVERRSADVPRLRLPFAICTSLPSINQLKCTTKSDWGYLLCSIKLK